MIAVQWRLATHSACLNNKVNKKLSTPKILKGIFQCPFWWYALAASRYMATPNYIRCFPLFNKRHTSNKGFAACWPTYRHAT